MFINITSTLLSVFIIFCSCCCVKFLELYASSLII